MSARQTKAQKEADAAAAAAANDGTGPGPDNDPGTEQPGATQSNAQEGGVDGPESGTQMPDPKDTGGSGSSDGGKDAPSGPTLDQQRQTASVSDQAGVPQPQRYDKGMVLKETGVSPEAWTGPEGDVPTAPTGDDPRNGSPSSGTDTSGKLRHLGTDPATAATGRTEANGLPINTGHEVDRNFGGNGLAETSPQSGGVWAESGNGTGRPAEGHDTSPDYPSTTITRTSSRATPVEPADVRLATAPLAGDVATSTDPTTVAVAAMSHVGDKTTELVDSDGNAVKPSEFFDVPEGRAANAFRVVKHRVSERYIVRNSSTPSQRLLFPKGTEVPVDQVEALIKLHG